MKQQHRPQQSPRVTDYYTTVLPAGVVDGEQKVRLVMSYRDPKRERIRDMHPPSIELPYTKLDEYRRALFCSARGSYREHWNQDAVDEAVRRDPAAWGYTNVVSW